MTVTPIRQDTNDLPDHPVTSQSWSAWPEGGHPSGPIPTDEIPEQRSKPSVNGNRRPRPKGLIRPSRKYETPGEMWNWHTARMGIAVLWTLTLTCCVIAGVAFVTIFTELIP